MAQTRGAASGTASKAIKSVPLGERASPEEYADLVAFMRGKSQVTVQTKRGILAQGWAPGDETSESPQTIALPIGGIARLHRTEGYMQNAETLGAVRGRRHAGRRGRQGRSRRPSRTPKSSRSTTTRRPSSAREGEAHGRPPVRHRARIEELDGQGR